MRKYIIVRIGQGMVTLLILATLVFLLARIIGSPVDMMLPADAPPAEREQMIQKMGLDKPLYFQYVEFMGNLLKGDIGNSIKFRKPVAELFFQRFPNTLQLGLVALGIAMVFGLALGMISGTHRGTMIDRFARGVSVIGMSAPPFWLGLLLMYIFAVELKILPVAMKGGIDSFILPALTWSFFLLAGTARLVRSSMIEVIDSEFVKLAKIKGASPSSVIWKHCFRNALLPIFTFFGVQLAFLLNGSVVIETIFAWPGVGRLIYEGITGRDYPLVQGCLILVGAMIIVISLIVDIAYAYIDPRLRVAGGTE